MLPAKIAMTSMQVLYEGHVQGIGFRYTVRQIAKGFDVTGFVRNLPDGRVELHASGEPEEVRAFLTAIGESELHAHIHKQTQHPVEASLATQGFQIRHD